MEQLLHEGSPGCYQALHADCVEDALSRLGALEVDVVIVDYRLPDGTGIELAERLRQTSSQAPVIVITGLEMPDQGSALLGRGAAEFMPKDEMTPKALARACTHAIVRGRLEREVSVHRLAEVAATRRELAARQAAERALADEQVARRRLSELQRLTSALSAVSTVDEVTRAATAPIALLSRAEAVSIYTVDGDLLSLRSSYGFTAEQLEPWRAIPLTTVTPLTDAVRQAAIMQFDSSAALHRDYRVAVMADRQWLTVPLVGEGPAIGVIALRYVSAEMPAAPELEFVALFASVLAQAVRRARLYEAARTAAEIEERLLIVLGHDLRSPLSTVMMATTLLLQAPAPSPLIQRIARSAKSMMELIAEILDRAAARQGRPFAAETLDDFALVVEDQLEELRASSPHREIRLVRARAAPFTCPRVRVAQVISNLVRNALHHGDPQAPVTVHTAVAETGVLLAVHNEGPVIEPSVLSTLFEPFARGAASQGTGMGLYIVREAVTGMGGSVAVKSDSTGTTFTVRLPRNLTATDFPATSLPPASS